MDKIIEKIITDVRSLYKQAEKRRKQKELQGEFFNVFNTIGLRTKEVRLHSAFIAELLNPRGSHGLSNKFLQAFLVELGLPSDYVKDAKERITERNIGSKTKNEGGRIDIIVEDGKKAVIIENKIFAEDQESQLLRYFNFGKKQFGKNFKLVYLTLDGDEPDEESLGGKDFPFEIFSYRNNIVDWLDECIEIAKDKPLARAVIIQYRDLVKQITNTDMDTKYEEKLLDMMVAPDNAIAMSELLTIEDEWFSRIMNIYIWKPLEEYAYSKNMKMDKYDEDRREGGAWIYKEEWEYCGLFVWTDSPRYWNNMYVSIGYYESPGRKRIKKENRIKLDCLEEEPDKEDPYGWELLHPDIRNWDSSVTKEIVTKRVVKDIIKKFEQILNEIEEKKIVLF